MAIAANDSLIVNKEGAPIDARTVAPTLEALAEIENPYVGLRVFVSETGKEYRVTKIEDVAVGAFAKKQIKTYEALPDLSGMADLEEKKHTHGNKDALDKIGESENGKPTYNDIALATPDDILEWSHGSAQISSVADNIATLSGTNVPVGVRTDKGSYYPVEKGSVVIDIANGQIKLDVTPYLAYDNAASFTGPWTVYYAAGEQGIQGNNALSFQIGTVTTLDAGASATAEATISDEGLVTLNLGIPKGGNGSDGVGISSIAKTGASGNVDTYTITLTNGQTSTFAVTNGKTGAKGTDGITAWTGTLAQYNALSSKDNNILYLITD